MNCIQEGLLKRKNLELLKENKSFEGVKNKNNTKSKKYRTVKSENIIVLLDILCKGPTNDEILFELYKAKKNANDIAKIGKIRVNKCFKNALDGLLRYKRANRAGDDIILDHAKVKKVKKKWCYVVDEAEND